MKSMIYIPVFWKIYKDYKKNDLQEEKCKEQYKIYLNYLSKKKIIENFKSFENI
tara:strand:- start:152 stop:313 length:162 start_codon:yes stop_codon:yes gene_type:complete